MHMRHWLRSCACSQAHVRQKGPKSHNGYYHCQTATSSAFWGVVMTSNVDRPLDSDRAVSEKAVWTSRACGRLTVIVRPLAELQILDENGLCVDSVSEPLGGGGSKAELARPLIQLLVKTSGFDTLCSASAGECSQTKKTIKLTPTV